jgi:hypothetical protein
MPGIVRAAPRRGLVAALLALALGLAACGDDSTEASGATTETAAPAATAGDDAAGDQTDEATASTDGDASDQADVPGENLFPDVDVVDISDGSTVNLADELGGGTKPVLLWFWAPH